MTRTTLALALPLALLLVGAGACTSSPDVQSAALHGSAEPATAASSGAPAASQRPDGWDAYWYGGLAELNTYTLTQNRYGADRTGEAVLLFVTEPFLAGAQVKQDVEGEGGEAVSVLKLNRIHRFTTGIYDYSLMLSAFTPVSRDRFPHTLKTTMSTQDWCGQSWWQLNYRDGDYEAQRRSYFQHEADAIEELDGVLLEDELPALVRLDPTLVPTGEQRLIPGAMFSSLVHVPPVPQRATIRFRDSGAERVLEVDYPELERTLAYRFAAEFPHRLLGWTETYRGEPFNSGELRATRRSAYWSENGVAFAALRDSLQLPR